MSLPCAGVPSYVYQVTALNFFTHKSSVTRAQTCSVYLPDRPDGEFALPFVLMYRDPLLSAFLGNLGMGMIVSKISETFLHTCRENKAIRQPESG